MLFKSSVFSQSSGSLGGTVFSHNSGGRYVRERTIPTDPATSFQIPIRTALSSLVARWNNVLTQTNRDSWDLYAANVTLLNPLGDPINVSGMNMFVRSNVPRLQGILPLIVSGPTTFDIGLLSPCNIVSAEETSQLVIVSYDATDAWNNAGGALMTYISRPQNVGVNFFKGPYRLAETALGSDPQVAPNSITAPFTITAGQRVWVKMVATLADGRFTEAQFLGPQLVATGV